MCQNHPLTCFDGQKAFKNISTTIHAMTKSFLPFRSAQDGKSTGVNCLVLFEHTAKMAKFAETPIYNKGILLILASFLGYEILLLLECTVDSE